MFNFLSIGNPSEVAIGKTGASTYKIFCNSIYLGFNRLYYIFPGVGISFRGQKEYWGAQLDTNMVNTSLFGTSYDYEISVSALCYPLARKEAGWVYGGLYLSAGLGAHLNTPHGYGLQLCSPLFLGYETKWINFSADIDLVYWIPYSNIYKILS